MREISGLAEALKAASYLIQGFGHRRMEYPKENVRTGRKRAGNFDALFHPAGKLRGYRFSNPVKPNISM